MIHDFASTKKLLDCKEFRSYADIFVETGTAAGDGVQRALDAGFQTIYSIEAQNEWFMLSSKRFSEKNKVFILFGESVDILQTLFWEQPTVFYLDAHPSSESSAGWKDLKDHGAESKYNQDSIIKAELKVILSFFKKPIIIIDDINGVKDNLVFDYMDMILESDPNYVFRFYDENLSGDLLYQDKLVVAFPIDAMVKRD